MKNTEINSVCPPIESELENNNSNTENVESILLKHAKFEIDLYEQKIIDAEIKENGSYDIKDIEMLSYRHELLDIIGRISNQGHSGGSIRGFMKSLEKLVDYKPLIPLTLEDDEFGEPYSLDGTRQNKRDCSVFKEKNGQIHCLNGVKSLEAYCSYFGENKIKKTGKFIYGGGGLIIIDKDNNITNKYFKNNYLNLEVYKEEKKIPEILVNRISVEYPEGYWTSFVREEELEKLKPYYIPEFRDVTDDEYKCREGDFKKEIFEIVNEFLKNDK